MLPGSAACFWGFARGFPFFFLWLEHLDAWFSCRANGITLTPPPPPQPLNPQSKPPIRGRLSITLSHYHQVLQPGFIVGPTPCTNMFAPLLLNQPAVGFPFQVDRIGSGCLRVKFGNQHACLHTLIASLWVCHGPDRFALVFFFFF